MAELDDYIFENLFCLYKQNVLSFPVSLQDIQMRKAFRSARTFQQQLFARTSMPSAMLATYARCDRPPPLERLNEFRDDGRDARKFYTDPDYFFELWRREMLQDTERIQHDRGKKVTPRAALLSHLAMLKTALVLVALLS